MHTNMLISRFRRCSTRVKRIFSERERRYMSARPSVCRLSVTFVHPAQPIEICGNVSNLFNTLAI